MSSSTLSGYDHQSCNSPESGSFSQPCYSPHASSLNSPSDPCSSSSSSRIPSALMGSEFSHGLSSPRPFSALARGVHIVELTESGVNPSPVTCQNQSDTLMEEYVTPQKLVRISARHLRALTGVDDLSSIQSLQLKVNTRDTSLGNFGAHLPNLTQLKLSDSLISTMRDVGSCLECLKVLWMARCGLSSIDGVSSMNNLTELYLAYNEISDISPCSMLTQLQILDLESNNIDDIDQVTFLALCQHLTNLTLDGNPLCVAPNPLSADPKYNYRRAVKRLMPQLLYLDDYQLSNEDDDTEEEEVEEDGYWEKREGRERRHSGVSVFDKDWQLLNELMKECPLPDDCVAFSDHPATGLAQTSTYRPGSALKPYTAISGFSQRPPSSHYSGSGSSPNSSRSIISTSANKPLSSDRLSDSVDEDGNTMCMLTTGDIVCGNLSRALKARARNSETNALTQSNKYNSAEDRRKNEEDKLTVDLAKELEQWKLDHQHLLNRIAESRKAQVLVIDHDDNDDHSNDDPLATDTEFDLLSLTETPDWTKPGSRSRPSELDSQYETKVSQEFTRIERNNDSKDTAISIELSPRLQDHRLELSPLHPSVITQLPSPRPPRLVVVTDAPNQLTSSPPSFRSSLSSSRQPLSCLPPRTSLAPPRSKISRRLPLSSVPLLPSKFHK